MNDFKREDRYIVLKIKDLDKNQLRQLRNHILDCSLPTRDCVVVEYDWPEYHFVWLMLEHRMAGYPVPDFNAVKCAADVQAAQSELAALREELVTAKAECQLHENVRASVIRDAVDVIQRLTAAEQRNAGLVELLRKARRAIDPSCAGKSLRGELDAALRTKPTESGASE